MLISTLRSFFNKYKIHLIAWSGFILWEVSVTGMATGDFGQIKAWAVHYVLNILLFYFHAHSILFILKNRSKYGIALIFLFIIFESFIYVSVAYSADYFILNPGGKHAVVFDKVYIFRTLWRYLYILGFSTGYFYLLKSNDERKQVEKLEKQSLVDTIEKQALENDLVQSQNNFLRSQINPHFLFNTLNFIYNDARKKAPMAADAIMNLAEMMRYALKRPEASEMVPLSEEVEQIEHLINLHKLRTANAINLELQITGDLFGLRFPPLILLTLVENIFKHGNIAHSSQPAQIRIDYTGDLLKISTINMINEVKKKASESHHVGLENISNRLSNFYGEGHVFRYYKDDLNKYITEIVVPVVNPMAGLNKYAAV